MSPPPRSPGWGTLLLVGPLCLATGALLAQWSPLGGPQQVWTAPPPDQVVEKRVVALPSLHPIVAKVKRGVVRIETLIDPKAPIPDQDDMTGDLVWTEGRDRGVVRGTGFVVNGAGLIVTNRHLVAGAGDIKVQVPDHRPRRAYLVGEDPLTDLAILRMDDPPPDLCVLPLGASENLRQGDYVLTIGNPYGFTQTVSSGVVGYVGRHLPRSDMKVTNSYLQFSAPINPGNSGGPVFDLHGHVVGVTTRHARAADGIAFAVPSATLKWVLDRLEASPDGRIRRAYMGMSFQSLGADENVAGVLVNRIDKGQPAEQAGVRVGDLLLRFGDQTLQDAAQLHDLVTTSAPGRMVVLLIERNGERLECGVTLGTMDRRSDDAERGSSDQ